MIDTIKRRVTSHPNLTLAVIAIGFAVLQLVLIGLDRFYGYDEGVYVLEARDIGGYRIWKGHRSLGVPLLMLPTQWIAPDSLAFFRLYFVLLSSLLLVLAFRPWLRLIGPTTLLAAAMLAVSWPVLFYGPTGLPNLIAGLAAVALLGVFLTHLHRGASAIPVILFGFLLGMVRPTETVAVVIAALTGVLLHARSPRDAREPNPWRALVPLAVGTSLAGALWVLESAQRFGGPIDRLRVMTSGVGSGERSILRTLAEYSIRLDGSTSNGRSPIELLLLILLVGGLVACLVIRSIDPLHRRWSLLAALAGGLILGSYLTFFYVDVRLLLPAICLFTIPIAIGYRRALAGAGPTAIAVVAIIALTLTGWSLSTARSRAESSARLAEPSRDIAAELRATADGEPCAFVTDFTAPAIQVGSGCLGGNLYTPTTYLPVVFYEVPGPPMWRFAFFFNDVEVDGSFLGGWDSRDVTAGTRELMLYEQRVEDGP